MINPIVMNGPVSEEAGLTLVEKFLAECYDFRHNVLSDKHEMRDKEVMPMLTHDVVSVLKSQYPELKLNHGMNVKVGRILRALSFEQKKTKMGSAFFLVSLQKAA